MPGNWGRQWLHFTLLLFTVVNGKGPPKVLIWRLKNSFYSVDMSHSPQEGCLTRMGLLWMLPSASVSLSRTGAVENSLCSFYSVGMVALTASPKFTSLVFSAKNILIPNKQLSRRTWHSWMQTYHRNETRLLTDVLGIPFDVYKFTGLCGHFVSFKKLALYLCSYCWLETK